MALQKQTPGAWQGVGGYQRTKDDGQENRRDDRNVNRIDFAAVNRAALPHAVAICRRLFPGGKIRAGEYVAVNSRRADNSAGSFSVNIRSGKWADFATGDAGGDLVSLTAFAHGVTQVEGAKILAQLIGWGAIQ